MDQGPSRQFEIMHRRDRHHQRHLAAFTLVEIVIVVAIIALLAAIAIPGLLRARKRAQAAAVKNDLRLVEAAVEQYALESGKAAGTPVAVEGSKGVSFRISLLLDVV